MKLRFIDLNRMPGDTADGGTGNSTGEKQNPGAEAQPGGDAEKSKEKGFFDKVKDALQEWSNNDQKEQEEDDTTP